jgi:hypothetical protein
VPADTEKPRPRPRLTGTVSLPAHVDDVLWLPDGKHLILRCNDGVARVLRRDQFGDDEPAAKLVAELKLPAGGHHLALTADGTELYAVVSAGGRLTAESRAHFWNVKRVLDGKDLAKADRVVALDVDTIGTATLTADGRRFVVAVIEPWKGAAPQQPNVGWNGGSRATEYAARFDRLSAKTGDRDGEWVKLDDDTSYAGHAFDPKANRLFVLLHAGDELLVRCFDLTGGKTAWERKLTGQAQKGAMGILVPSPDGSWVGVVQPTLFANPVQQGPGGRGGVPGGRPQQVSYSSRTIPVLLSAKTGEPVELPADDVTHAQLFGFSADGRLMAGTVHRDTGVSQTLVWDTKTGQVLKAWAGRGDVHLEFAPIGYDLLAVERERKDIYGAMSVLPQGFRPEGGQQWTTTREVVRTEYKSTLGVWDLAPLLK